MEYIFNIHIPFYVDNFIYELLLYAIYELPELLLTCAGS